MIVISAVVFVYASKIPADNSSYEDTGGLLLGNTQNTDEGSTIEDVNIVYYLKGDSTRMNLAGSNTKHVRFHEPQEEYGFDDVDIVVEGSVGEKYTIIFGSNNVTDDQVAIVGSYTSSKDVFMDTNRQYSRTSIK